MFPKETESVEFTDIAPLPSSSVAFEKSTAPLLPYTVMVDWAPNVTVPVAVIFPEDEEEVFVPAVNLAVLLNSTVSVAALPMVIDFPAVTPYSLFLTVPPGMVTSSPPQYSSAFAGTAENDASPAATRNAGAATAFFAPKMRVRKRKKYDLLRIMFIVIFLIFSF